MPTSISAPPPASFFSNRQPFWLSGGKSPILIPNPAPIPRSSPTLPLRTVSIAFKWCGSNWQR